MSTDQDTRTRAAELRQRRTEHTRPRMTTPAAGRPNSAPRAQTSAQPSMARPVVVRNTTFGTPISRQSATQRPRRQYYVAVEGTPGAEVRLPALPQLHLGWRSLSGAIVIALLVIIGSLLWSPFFQVETIQIQGMSRIDPAEIQAIADVANLSIIEVNAKQIRDDLTTAFPDIERVVVSVGLPNLIGITITERQPMLAWQHGDQTRWIDSQGVIFPARGEAPAMLTIVAQDDPPLANPPAAVDESATSEEATGDKVVVAATQEPREPERLDPALLVTAQKLSGLLPAGTALAYTGSDGLGWQDSNGTYVYIGSNVENFDQKFALYQQIAAELSNRGIQPALISVEYLNTPYYRLEQ
jgi:cell division protein FtsQ